MGNELTLEEELAELDNFEGPVDGDGEGETGDDENLSSPDNNPSDDAADPDDDKLDEKPSDSVVKKPEGEVVKDDKDEKPADLSDKDATITELRKQIDLMNQQILGLKSRGGQEPPKPKGDEKVDKTPSEKVTPSAKVETPPFEYKDEDFVGDVDIEDFFICRYIIHIYR